MALAPEPCLSACLATIRQAILECRAQCWGKTAIPEQMADLMDAIHNIPGLLQAWEQCDIAWLRETLMDYDRKWAPTGNQCLRLCAVFDAACAQRQ